MAMEENCEAEMTPKAACQGSYTIFINFYPNHLVHLQIMCVQIWLIFLDFGYTHFS